MYKELNVNASLKELALCASERKIIDFFKKSTRVSNFSLLAADLYLDFSKQNINEHELTALIKWSEQLNLTEKINAMFLGDKINNTENRAVLHTLLRSSSLQQKQVLGDVAQDVVQTEQKLSEIVNSITQGKKKGVAGQPFTDVLAIGIGGSFYGIKVGLSALKPYCKTGINVHVLANVDGAAVAEKLALLSVETTLVVVISKTFTTQETLLNANAVKEWMLSEYPQNNDVNIIAKQWLAVSTNINQATEFGLDKNNILPMWDWVGGRFSVWSAVGLPLAIAIGMDHFNAFKQGAHHMDEHFKSAPARHNMPIIMALIGIWNRNFLDYPTLAILPYDHALRALPGYLQQTDMESNGKSVSNQGKKLPWLTAPVVFGQEGTNGQHAFMQLMHQSDDIIPTDFIVSFTGSSRYKDHHQVLVANCIAQSEALMQGKTLKQARVELADKNLPEEQISNLALHKSMKGNTPSNTLAMKALTPNTLGSLLALYEHKIFVQGVMWQLNSFDQWGVELGKQLSSQVLKAMTGDENNNLSSSSQMMINQYKELN